MDTALFVVEMIFFILAAISILSMFIFNIIDRIKLKKLEEEEQRQNEEIAKFITSIIEATIKKEEKEKTQKEEKINNYSDMNILDLREIAKKKKIKGYYNLHKDELVKALEETENL